MKKAVSAALFSVMIIGCDDGSGSVPSSEDSRQDSELQELRDSVDALQAQLDSTDSSDVSDLQSALTSLEMQVDANEAAITALATDVSELDTVSSDELNSEIAAISAQIDALEQDLLVSNTAVAFHVGPSADLAINNIEKINSLEVRSGTGDIDTEGGWSSSSDDYTVPYSGMWYLSASCGLNNVTSGNWVVVRFYTDSIGTILSNGVAHSSSTQDTVARASTITYLNKGDKLTVYCGHSGSANQFRIVGGDTVTYFEGMLLGS